MPPGLQDLINSSPRGWNPCPCSGRQVLTCWAPRSHDESLQVIPRCKVTSLSISADLSACAVGSRKAGQAGVTACNERAGSRGTAAMATGGWYFQPAALQRGLQPGASAKLKFISRQRRNPRVKGLELYPGCSRPACVPWSTLESPPSSRRLTWISRALVSSLLEASLWAKFAFWMSQPAVSHGALC